MIAFHGFVGSCFDDSYSEKSDAFEKSVDSEQENERRELCLDDIPNDVFRDVILLEALRLEDFHGNVLALEKRVIELAFVSKR